MSDMYAANKVRKDQSLKRLIKTKMTTINIGDIARCEDYFGFLWGHGKKAEERTEKEQKWFKLWDELRTSMLNHGNNQIRGLEAILNKEGVR